LVLSEGVRRQEKDIVTKSANTPSEYTITGLGFMISRVRTSDESRILDIEISHANYHSKLAGNQVTSTRLLPIFSIPLQVQSSRFPR
jgi:hypothetical protein